MNEYSRVNWQDGTVLQNAKVTIDGVDYDVQPAVESGTTPLNATNLNKMDAGIKNASEDIITLNENKISHTVIELIAVSDTAPVECETGDKYYDTTEQYIYTATGHNTWGSQGVLPVSTYLYADITENKMYYYDGTEFKSYGGGGETVPAEIFVGDVLPEDADGIKLWLTDDDALDGEGNYISNEYGTSQEIGYSQEYLNGKLEDVYSTDEINTGKIWIDGKPIYRKVVHINSLPNATATQYNHNISNMGTLVKVDGMRHFVYENNDIWSPMIWLNPGASSGIAYDSISFEVNKTGINVLTGNRDRSSNDAYFILEYTKTTD